MVSNIFTNDIQLKSKILLDIKKALEYTMEQILEEYKDLILEIVYGAGNPSVYKRNISASDSFLNTWHTDIKDNVMSYIGTLNQNYDEMNLDTENFIHGSFGVDYRPYMANIIYEGLSGALFGDGYWRNKRDAWAPLIEEMDNGKLTEWFKDGMKLQGITITER